MSIPTDAEAGREFRVAARLMAALAVGFFLVGGVTVALASPGATSASRATSVEAPPPEPAPVAAAPAAVPPGSPATPAAAPAADPDAPLVVQVELGEFYFAPQRITAPAGRLIRFEVTNPGVVPHEFLIGDRHAQDDAEKEMAKGGAWGKSHSHDGTVSILLGAGESGVLEATFDEPGELLIGCHVPGHWAAGMKGTFTVTAS